ncbi:hypothetical protein BD289DRAFT_446605 [Coniella lustricola]|uniref:AAA+ ATPase domain-containing protein n=1 Tax=Coniella lustricola TaxID=2025994 RepID=A0A2T2ZTS8_9PEZI|nr:hypothetical protein BD289DRAFT_446605 [Coniella lustricola]
MVISLFQSQYLPHNTGHRLILICSVRPPEQSHVQAISQTFERKPLQFHTRHAPHSLRTLSQHHSDSPASTIILCQPLSPPIQWFEQMGPLVVAMAGSDSLAEPKKLHPFFTAPKTLEADPKAARDLPTHLKVQDNTNCNKEEDPGPNGSGQENDVPKRRKRKTAEEADGDWDVVKKPRRGRKKTVPQAATIISHFAKATGEETDGNTDEDSCAVQPSSRGTGPEEVPKALASPPAAPTACDPALAAPALTPADKAKSPEQIITTSSNQHVLENDPPKKVLQLNRKTGTIGSPPKPKPSKASRQAEATEIDTNIFTSKQTTKPTRLIKIVYGTDDASKQRIGRKINNILAVPPSTSHTKRRLRTKQPAAGKIQEDHGEVKELQEGPKKEPHPFFSGKSTKKTIEPAVHLVDDAKSKDGATTKPASTMTRPRIFSSTPCSPKKNRVAPSNFSVPQFGIKSLGLKTPGARLPAWPPRDMVHVRGEDAAPCLARNPKHSSSARKCKGKITRIPPTETVLHDVVDKLSISDILDHMETINNDVFQPPPLGLRLPQKHFESGMKLEKRITRQLKNAQNPALARLRYSLATTLAAFDRFTCESLSWAHKYAPQSAIEVLQYGREAFLLREWLEALKVQAVDTGEPKPKQAKPPKKKRKKNQLGNFVVGSDEEEDDLMGEISDVEEDWSPDKRGTKKTVIRAGDAAAKSRKDGRRLTNAVVISGPHGCGKTAAVYAIAKELDFEIFEINAGSRRSGKDILEKIGDMTRNHLVQHHPADAPSNSVDEEEVAQDIKSGKQSTMNAFFKQQTTPQSAEPKKIKKQPAIAVKADKKPASKGQKQSLILLDEVDVLYDEDKQFWNTVMTLIAQSRRPFVMTCNDEELVPLQALSLHGIFRFSAPPTDLAVDRMLLIAACEGHALSRTAVEALYEARQQDMRACLMDLNYWCQIAVGDRRAGFDWFYPRWPKGCDLDEDGKVIRVISQDTYTEGLGWLGHDYMTHEAQRDRHEEELLQEARDSWQIDVCDWHESLDLALWATQQQCTTSADRLRVLQEYDNFADALSTADLFSSYAFAAMNEEQVDCTQPELQEKSRDDFTLGRQLLDAPMLSTYDSLSNSVPIALRCCARKNLQRSNSTSPSASLQPLDEAGLIARIREHAKAMSTNTPIDRDDFSNAFDRLAVSAKAPSALGYLDYSVFDGVFSNIAIDIAPYVRSIISFEKDLQSQRQKLSSLLSQGGTKRRKTRASNAALEGGSRSTTRRDKWFDVDLNGVLVMQTAGEGWSAAVKEMKPDSQADSTESVPGPSLARKRRAIGLTGTFADDQSSSASESDADQLA